MADIREIPAIRFKGFADKWEQRQLGDVVEFFSGLTYSPSDVVDEGGTFVLRSSNVKNGEIVNADNVFVNSNVVNCDNVRKGDIAVVVRNGSRSLIGKHAQIKRIMNNTVIGAFMTGIHTEQSNFINALLDTEQFNKEVEKNLGATINQITNGAFKNMQFCFPHTSEQTQIGIYFQNLDKLIRLHQATVNKLTNLKKAMLEKMFPKDGADVPEIRFKDFEGAWEERRLGDEVADIVGGGTPNTFEPSYWNGDIDWYSPTEIGNEVFVNGSVKKITELGLKNSSAKLLPANKTILFTSRAGIGNMAILKRIGATNQGFQSLVLKDGYETYFIYSMGHLIKEFADRNSSGSTFLEISGKMLGKMVLRVPSVKEQKKIGNYFQNLDKLITLHQTELAKLNNLKKACLEKMFV
jgi:type I restriction enzyme S subunit